MTFIERPVRTGSLEVLIRTPKRKPSEKLSNNSDKKQGGFVMKLKKHVS